MADETNKSGERLGRPPLAIPPDTERKIRLAVQQKLDASEETLKNEYLARLSRFREKNMVKTYPQIHEKRLTIQSVPEYARCVDLPLADVLRCSGAACAWPSEGMAQTAASLAKLSPERLRIARRLISMISPTFWQDETVMSALEFPLDRVMYVLDHYPMKRVTPQIELFKENYDRPPAWKRDPKRCSLYDLQEIMRWSSILDVSPAWLLCWTQWPVLAGTPEQEWIIIGYSFLNDTLKDAFRLFLAKLAQTSPETAPARSAAPAATLASRPKPAAFDDEKHRMYNNAKMNVVSNASAFRNNQVPFSEFPDDCLSAAIKCATDPLLSGDDQALTKSIYKLAHKKDCSASLLSKAKKGERKIPATVLLWICDELFHLSLHGFLSGLNDYVTLPRWLGATANLLSQNPKIGLDKLIARESLRPSDQLYPPEESIGPIFFDRMVELAEDRYVDRVELLHETDSHYLMETLVQAIKKSGNIGSTGLTLYKLCCYSVLTRMPEDYFVVRNYLKYLEPVYRRENGSWGRSGQKVRKLLQHILVCKPEFRSELLADVWMTAFFAQ